MAVMRTTISSVAGVLALLTAIAVVLRQEKIRKGTTLRSLQNDLRRESNRLRRQNVDLRSGVDDLLTQTESLEAAEEELKSTLDDQEKKVDELISLVKENQEILDEMEKRLRAQVYQIVLSAVLHSDHTEDMRITGYEIDDLILRLRHIDGVDVDEAHLRWMIGRRDGDVMAIVEILREASVSGSASSRRGGLGAG
eukprot:CAMPEP_0183319120 /NCGR_PEP_ID=MMETSP0160_2-20130417/62631_1 /TAXON_ID=2839 ORGANISM="Odontella Sinensis, Strain Grunow 1884" /NCGR_SAMPLE_ID=MMETSP0160_2 /ASSEMBLY_ACC=CAM_ASM_000250 /LENGTH=195 /DNA_ID=CAMNT_0025485539 /DNA_START=88 /DNA_END=671 /DNA_ORIENTATION=-